MKQWLKNIGRRLAGVLYGRYGSDELTLALLLTAIVLSLLSVIPVVGFVFSLLSLLTILYSLFRTFSKNVVKRQRERARFLKLTEGPRAAWRLRRSKKRDKHTHVYFKCPACRSVLRVPKGKGEILVTCPKCNRRIPKKT